MGGWKTESKRLRLEHRIKALRAEIKQLEQDKAVIGTYSLKRAAERQIQRRKQKLNKIKTELKEIDAKL